MGRCSAAYCSVDDRPKIGRSENLTLLRLRRPFPINAWQTRLATSLKMLKTGLGSHGSGATSDLHTVIFLWPSTLGLHHSQV